MGRDGVGFNDPRLKENSLQNADEPFSLHKGFWDVIEDPSLVYPSSIDQAGGVDQTSLYELVADYGEVYGHALPRDSFLLKSIDQPDHWINLSDAIGFERAQQLAAGADQPSASEMQALIFWQVEQALEAGEIHVTPVIWLCPLQDSSAVLAVESWDDDMDVELKFRLIGKYQTRSSAIEDLNTQYIFDACEI